MIPVIPACTLSTPSWMDRQIRTPPILATPGSLWGHCVVTPFPSRQNPRIWAELSKSFLSKGRDKPWGAVPSPSLGNPIPARPRDLSSPIPDFWEKPIPGDLGPWEGPSPALPYTDREGTLREKLRIFLGCQEKPEKLGIFFGSQEKFKVFGISGEARNGARGVKAMRDSGNSRIPEASEGHSRTAAPPMTRQRLRPNSPGKIPAKFPVGSVRVLPGSLEPVAPPGNSGHAAPGASSRFSRRNFMESKPTPRNSGLSLPPRGHSRCFGNVVTSLSPPGDPNWSQRFPAPDLVLIVNC